MIVLAISTSSPRGTVAVARGGAIVARIEYDGATSHAERLFAAIDEAMQLAGATRRDLGAIACDVGPGSFTGVRVGVSAAQGIALGLAIPAVGVGSLEAMARAARDEGVTAPVLAVLDAKKGEIFAAVHDAAGLLLWGPKHVARDSAPQVAIEIAGLLSASPPAPEASLVTVGVVADGLSGLSSPRRAPALDLPDAVAVAREAVARLSARCPAGDQDAAALEPLYVRAPDARPTAEALAGERPV
jgi:tRNA threonylcarbamoyladenosine biosynthesis protein TsaB